MLYCTKCCVPFEEGSRCPACDSKKIRPLTDEDLCFVVEEEPMWAEAIEDIFRDNQIPFCTQDDDTAWLGAIGGPRLIRRRFLTPWPFYAQATELAQFLSQAEPIAEDTEP